MISIAGRTADLGPILAEYPAGGIEAQILGIMADSRTTYRYDNLEQLQFELKLRRSIVNAARDLAHSNLSFRVFRKSKANPDYWQRTDEGGFQLQPGVKPSDAIRDIYKNSSMYGTECATAMVIVYFKALVDILPEGLFNQLFPDIYLMNWKRLDRDLGITTIRNPADFLPGDAMYFKNPDVNPATPEWQGENVFDLGGGMYYGHGIGIANADRIIKVLNSQRIAGATESAYLMVVAQRPNFRHLQRKYNEYIARNPQ